MSGDIPVLCFSHLRWNFVFQRPQQVLSRLAKTREILYVEEPRFEERVVAHYIEERPVPHVTVLCPVLPPMDARRAESEQRRLIDAHLLNRSISRFIAWYYTPMALGYSPSMSPVLTVYDCMDELSMFAFAPADLQKRERELFAAADVVFTGGRSLYYNKRRHHANVHCFPSAVDSAHFAAAAHVEPPDLKSLSRPRFGFYGVIDERFDIPFLRDIAELRPEWQFVVVGPVVKIDPAILPSAENIHYIGSRSYDELPSYLQHWDAAMLLFARNDATRYISPTKTLEYLAAHKPVISTPIADVVDPYGTQGLVAIAESPNEFVRAADRILREGVSREWHSAVDRIVADASWDVTVHRMESELQRALQIDAIAR
ncbi:MAG: glycosyltransferase [Candidatus Eremiobacteraeota bacterium]|nr:glycosyltransferase [Candidatus Eremiobacteraeota bacterium]